LCAIPLSISSSDAGEKFMRMVSWSIRLQSAGTWSLNMATGCYPTAPLFCGEDTLVDNEDLPVVKKESILHFAIV
jgi:hypothetical protein